MTEQVDNSWWKRLLRIIFDILNILLGNKQSEQQHQQNSQDVENQQNNAANSNNEIDQNPSTIHDTSDGGISFGNDDTNGNSPIPDPTPIQPTELKDKI